MGPDIECPSEDFGVESRKKDSYFFHYSAFACFLVLVSLVFFSSSASAPLRQQYGFVEPSLDLPKYETNLDLSRQDFQPLADVENTVVKSAGRPSSHALAKVSQMVELNSKCQVNIRQIFFTIEHLNFTVNVRSFQFQKFSYILTWDSIFDLHIPCNNL